MDGRPVIIGLLGGIASGKSTVASLLGELGARVVDADRIAHEVLADPETASEIAAIFGDDALDESGRPDRSRIARAAFSDGEKLARLEAVLHPRIRLRMEDEIRAAAGAKALVLDAPLLLEGGLVALADVVVYVEAPEAERVRRAEAERDWEPGEIARREARQAPLREKRRRAEKVILNNGSPEELSRRVSQLYREVLDEGTCE